MAIQPDNLHHHRRHQSRVTATLKALIRTRITAGALVVLPILITIWVVWVVFSWLRWCSEWLVRAVLTSQWLGDQLQSLGMTWTGFTAQELREPRIQWSVGIFSVVLTFFLLYIIGMFAANIVGRRVLDLIDQIVERVPLAKTVYRSIKQIIGTFSGDKGQNFQRVALIPFPSEKMRCVGFVTNIFRDSVTGEELCSVFISTTPNPTTGYLQILKRGDITELDWTVEEGVRAVMSAGILKPDFLTIVPNKNLPADVRAGPDVSLPEAPPPEGTRPAGAG